MKSYNRIAGARVCQPPNEATDSNLSFYRSVAIRFAGYSCTSQPAKLPIILSQSLYFSASNLPDISQPLEYFRKHLISW